MEASHLYANIHMRVGAGWPHFLQTSDGEAHIGEEAKFAYLMDYDSFRKLIISW